MKEFLREVVLLVLFFFFGIAVQTVAPIEDFFNNIIVWLYKVLSPVTKGYIYFLPGWAVILMFVVILMVIGIIVTRITRTIVHSKNVKALGVVISIFITIIIGIPATFFLMTVISRGLSTADGISYSMFYSIFFAIILRVISHAFGFSYRKMLEEPVKNCKVLLCEATSENSYEVVSVKAKKLTFEQAFSYIRNNPQEIAKRQFYQIVETGAFGLKKIESWNYYRNGSNMDCSEEQFLRKLYLVNTDEDDVIKLKLKHED